jgi:putative ABC transport system substrate-binding protein
MNRRDFVRGLAGAAVALPGMSRISSVHAQAGQPLRRVAVFLGSSREHDAESQRLARILEGTLRSLGWSQGANLLFDYRFSSGDEAVMTTHVAELIKLGPDVIVVRGNRPTMLVKQATATIPVVFAQVGDPVGSGLINNLGRPGGNITGFTHFEPLMGSKWLETLKELAPVRQAAMLMHPETPANIAFLHAAEAAAPALGMAVSLANVRNTADIERAVAAAAGPDRGMVVFPHDVTAANHQRIVDMAMLHRIPAVYPYSAYARDGGLASYSFDIEDHWRRVGGYVDRLLRSEKPASLPVQAPVKFELTINLRTARALELAIPLQLLARADEVIE